MQMTAKNRKIPVDASTSDRRRQQRVALFFFIFLFLFNFRRVSNEDEREGVESFH